MLAKKWLARLPYREADLLIVSAMDHGTLALFIAFTILDNSVMAVPAAFYSISMFITAGLFAAWLKRTAAPA